MSNSTHPSQGRQYASVFDLNWGSPVWSGAAACAPTRGCHDRGMRHSGDHCIRCGWLKRTRSGHSRTGRIVCVRNQYPAPAFPIHPLREIPAWLRPSCHHGNQFLPMCQVCRPLRRPLTSAQILAAQLAGGFIAILVGLSIQKIRILFPPIITGTVVFTIGLSLYPTAINYMAGGTSSPDYGSWKNWLAAFFTLAVVVGLNHFAKGTLKLASILIGIITGYIFASFLGL